MVAAAWRLRINKIYKNCSYYVIKFMEETSLHGLKFISDSAITIWERSYFFLSFVVATIITAILITNIYEKWDETPVIIGISPKATSILEVPFPAVTICNMNQALLSKVSNYSRDSFEYGILRYLCNPDVDIKFPANSNNTQGRQIRMSTFVAEHSQPCERLLVACKFGALNFNCKDIFRDVVTDEGLCCIFNVVSPEMLYRSNISYVRDLDGGDKAVAVEWNAEDGYPENLPTSFYPRTAVGIGISLGFSITLNAEVDEYLCSSTDGPGFKISLHNPVDTSQVKETGLALAIGYETRLRIDSVSSEATHNIRDITRYSRQCLFNDEMKLHYYKVYTRHNCENECVAMHYWLTCHCIPYTLPLIFDNATICTIENNSCLKNATKKYNNKPLDERKCRQLCLPSCFDLAYLPDAFLSPLANRNFSIRNGLLSNLSTDYISKNMAIVHIYYRESVFYGSLKNVYIGFTEFLSNIGGVLGLFTGFSFISVAEIIYFSIIRPLFDRKRRTPKNAKDIIINADNQIYNNWMSGELRKPTSQPKLLLKTSNNKSEESYNGSKKARSDNKSLNLKINL